VKIEVVQLTDLFTVIKKQVMSSNIPEKKKKGMIKNMQNYAKIGFDLGRGDVVEIEIKD